LDWKASGYLQVWDLERPERGLPKPGALDDSGREAGGWRTDGFFVRRLELKMEGPLGWDAWSARLGVQTDLAQVGLTDALVAWQVLPSLRVQAGQLRLPYGAEQQRGSGSLVTMDRGLAWGLQNYGHVDAWGFGLLSERGLGVRADWQAESGDLRPFAQAGAFQAKGLDYYHLDGGGGRAGFKAGTTAVGLEAAESLFAGVARSSWLATSYEGLGQDRLRTPAWFSVEDLGHPTVLTWGPDLRVDLAPLHGEAELSRQEAGRLSRGGGGVTTWMDLPLTLRGATVYLRWDQGWSEWADGIHVPNALYRAFRAGLAVRTWTRSTLKLERFELSGDDLNDAFPGQLWLLQWQVDL
jgi:hypothetical protein